jgi:hypothetical protein
VFGDGIAEELAGALLIVGVEAFALVPWIAWTNAYTGRHGRGQHRRKRLRKPTPWPSEKK